MCWALIACHTAFTPAETGGSGRLLLVDAVVDQSGKRLIMGACRAALHSVAVHHYSRLILLVAVF
jgi:hypothetical protein